MDDLRKLLEATKTIESILEKDFGGSGRGLHEKLTQVSRPVPEYLVRKIRRIATIRNKSVHEAGFEVENFSRFLEGCEQVIVQLRELAAAPRAGAYGRGPTPVAAPHLARAPLPTQEAPAHRSSRPSGLSQIMLGVLGAMVVGMVGVSLWGPPQDADTDAPERSSSSSSPAPQPPSAPVAARAASSAAAQSAPTGRTPAAPERASRAAPVALSGIALRFDKGSFGRKEATITATLHNHSSRAVGQVSLHARLFINGEARPVIDTARQRGLSALFGYLGDSGLRAGEKRTITIRLGHMADAVWRSPDVLNAASHCLELALAGYQDGANQSIPAQGPYTSSGTLTAPGTAASAAPRTPAAAAAVAPSKALGLQGISVRYAKGTFGRPEAQIQLTLTNRTGHTIANASIGARLFVDGQDQPVVPGDALFAYLGEAGLGAGQTRTITLSAGHMAHHSWRAPDAIHAHSRRVELAVLSYTDGRGNQVPVSTLSKARWQ